MPKRVCNRRSKGSRQCVPDAPSHSVVERSAAGRSARGRSLRGRRHRYPGPPAACNRSEPTLLGRRRPRPLAPRPNPAPTVVNAAIASCPSHDAVPGHMQTITLRTLYAIVFIGHDRRQIVHVRVTRHPTAGWVGRQLLEATPWGTQPRHLIRDRDRCYGSDFVARASRIGIHAILTPVRAPNANAVAERVIGTLRRECLDHLIVLNERHLSRVLHEYVDQYNTARPHRTLGLDSPHGRESRAKPCASATVLRHEVLGGL